MANTVSLKIVGLLEMQKALRTLPAHLAMQAGSMIVRRANSAASEIVGKYPVGPTGNLKNRVRVFIETSRWGTAARVRSLAPHAHLYEFGTRLRKGAGKMPAFNVFVPIMNRERRLMYQDLQTIIESQGLEVTEHAA